MQKRTVKIGDYDTAQHGWTLNKCTLQDPALKENYVEKSGGDGSWNLTTATTGGIPRYKVRTLEIRLECSEGDRDHRENLINELVNTYDGLEWPIVIPDRPEHYLTGQVHVGVEFSDLAHAAVTITATCEPWLYRAKESIVELTAAESVRRAVIHNSGRRAVVPVLSVSGNIRIGFGVYTTQLTDGMYEWSPLLLTQGLNELEYTGSGTLTLTYREAVLR